MNIKNERIKLQQLALSLELYESDGRTVPMPVLTDLRNLMRDINLKITGKPE